ncbi:hypothetical protein, partial [Nocardia jinanensis]
MLVARNLIELGQGIRRRLDVVATRWARGAAHDLSTTAGGQVRGTRIFAETGELSREEIERHVLDRDYRGADAHAVSAAGRAVRDLSEELIMRSSLRELERKRWTLGRELDARPNAREGLIRKLEEAEQEHRELTAALDRHIARREDLGVQRWEVRNSDQAVRELRDSENRRRAARERIEALKDRREQLRGELRRLRGDTTADGGHEVLSAADPGNSVAPEPRWRDLETPHDDRAARELRDLTEARRNVDWMVGEQAKEQKRLEKEIQRLDNEVPKERER